MSTWMYQLNQKSWAPNRFRIEVWEGERWSWPVRTGLPKGSSLQAGDVIVFFYAPSGGSDPGFYGWAVVLEWYEDNRDLYFRAVAPTDHLKMHPWWDESAQALADTIRGKMKQRTIWNVPDKLVPELRNGITRWIGGNA